MKNSKPNNEDLSIILKLDKRSLYRHRKSGDLTCSKFGGKIYYDLKEVKKFMKKIME